MSEGRNLQGQEFDKETGLIAPFTQYTKDHDAIASEGILGDASTDINPVDRESALVRVYTAPAVSGISFSFPGVTNVNLPLVLTSLSVTYNAVTGSGFDYREVGAGVWQGPSGGFNLTPSARASGTASILPDLDYRITEPRGQNVPTVNYVFYMSGGFSAADVITQLTTILTKTSSGVLNGVVTTTTAHGLVVNQPFQFINIVAGSGGISAGVTYFVKTVPNATSFTYSATAGGATITTHNANNGTTLAALVQAWPVFRPETHVFTLKGQQVSISQNAESLLQYRWSQDSINYLIAPAGGSLSEGANRENGVTIRSIRLPPTIHGLLAVSSPTQSAITTVQVKADVPGVAGSGGAPDFVGITNHPVALTYTASASVSPTTLSATSGLTQIPTNGLYISNIQAAPYRYGLIQVRVELVNFNHFA